MRRGISRLLLSGGIIAAALAVALPASATTTWTVSGGTSWTASLQSGASVVLADSTAGTSITCTVSSAAGTIKNGTGLSGTGIGTVTSFTLGTSSIKCTGPFGTTCTATQKAGTIWNINVVSYSGGVTTGDITGIDLIVNCSDIFGVCTAEVIGTANFTYNNSTGVLTLTGSGTLTVTSATGSGCAGLIKTSDTITIKITSGGFLFSPVLTITSP